MPNKGLTHIANPLYDVVFRYMMEDNRVAKLFLSAVLGEEVLELVLSPTEFSKKIGGESGITVTRMDFNARVKQADGRERVILIELQKAKFYHQIMRFRNYLGKQYQNPQNVGKTGEPLPIYPVYILAESFTEEKIPVIRVIRSYTDAATQSNIAEKHPFIEALTHDATVIQAEHLTGNRRTLLEKMLSIFDQSAQTDLKGHILALNEAAYPEAYHPVIRRLHKALQNPQIEEEMDLEDEVLAELHKKDELLAAALLREEEALQREEEAKQREEEAKQREEEAKQREEEAKQREEEAKQREEEAKQRSEQERSTKNNLIKRLFALGLSVAEIARDTGMKETEVQKIVENH